MLEEEVAAAGEAVAAPAGQDVQEHAGRLDFRAVSRGGDLHFLEAVEGVVGDGRPHRRRIGHIHPVQVVLVLGPRRACRRKQGLLAALGAPHIDLGHHDSRRLLQHRPDVPRVRQLLENRPVHRFPDAASPQVERPPGDSRDAFGDAGDREPEPDFHGRAGLDDHFGGRRFREPEMRRRNPVGAGLQAGETEAPGRSGGLRAPRSPTDEHEGDPGARQDASGGVEDHPVHPAGRLEGPVDGSGRRRRPGQQDTQEARQQAKTPPWRGGEGGIRTLGAVSRATA